MEETRLGLFSLGGRQVWAYSVYEMRCLFIVVGLIACFIVLPHWDNMS